MEILEKVEQLKAELDSLRPLDAEIEARIWQKLRLDWNYHSNKLEGNTYSYGETKMLLTRGLTAGGKPVRDHEEITGHDQAITFILDSIRQDEPLTEVFIRHLHKLVLVKPFWSPTKTPDGKPGKRLIKVGEYKTEPNHVLTQSGAMFYFAEPIETPAKMQELLEWFRSKAGSSETNAVLLAAEFHYRFVRIHPFDDGNGRLARLLMNFVLMKNGFPPVIIKNEDKDNYIAVLEQADFAILEPFLDYVASNLAHSLEIMIRGAKGEDIEEPEDLDRELLLIEKRLEAAQDRISIGRTKDTERNRELLVRIVQRTLEPLAIQFSSRGRKFDQFYRKSKFSVKFGEPLVQTSHSLKTIERLRDEITNVSSKILLLYEYSHFLLENVDRDRVTFSFISSIVLRFHEFNYYDITSGDPQSTEAHKKLLIQKSYFEDLDSAEINKLVRFEINRHKNRLNFATEYYESLE